MFGSAFSFIGLLGLPVLIAQWVGIIALRRSARGTPWLLMICGISISSLMALWPVVSIFVGKRIHAPDHILWFYLPALVAISANILFAVGFALHGLQSSRATARQAELEELIVAMSEEMDRLREAPRQ